MMFLMYLECVLYTTSCRVAPRFTYILDSNRITAVYRNAIVEIVCYDHLKVKICYFRRQSLMSDDHKLRCCTCTSSQPTFIVFFPGCFVLSKNTVRLWSPHLAVLLERKFVFYRCFSWEQMLVS